MCVVAGCEKATARGRRVCSMHAWRMNKHGSYDLPPKRTPDYAARFWPRVDFLSSSHGCWLWVGGLSDTGYGSFRAEKEMGAHRWAYQDLYGPIPAGMQLDHLCRNAACVNPSHLEVVTPRVNNLRSLSVAAENARKTHCVHGHDLTDPANLYAGRTPTHRRCKACAQRANRARSA